MGALFLDDGFGALDNPSLDADFDAIEATAQMGRLVAVIRHVKAVAERITDVLAVVASVRTRLNRLPQDLREPSGRRRYRGENLVVGVFSPVSA